MVTTVLYQIFIAVGIVVGVMLIFNLWRFYKILERIEDVTEIASSQAKELNEHLTNIENFLAGLPETIKGFLLSIDFIKALKEKFTKSDKEKGD